MKLIDKEEMLKQFDRRTKLMIGNNNRVSTDSIRHFLENRPVIDAVDIAHEEHGYWIEVRESEISGWNPEFAGYDPVGWYECSQCGAEAIFDCNDEYVLLKYCPNCGARMDGGMNDENT